MVWDDEAIYCEIYVVVLELSASEVWVLDPRLFDIEANHFEVKMGADSYGSRFRYTGTGSIIFGSSCISWKKFPLPSNSNIV